MNISEIIESDIRTKIELLCWGLKTTELSKRLFAEQNPFGHMRTGNAGLALLIGESHIAANVPVGQRYTDFSPYSLIEDDDGDRYVLLKNGAIVCQCAIVPTPQWYRSNTSDGIPIGKIMLQEGTSTLITAVCNACDYFKNDEACAFCAINRYSDNKHGVKQKSARQVAEAVAEAEKYSSGRTLDLTGGNTISPDKGALAYVEPVKEVRRISKIAICAEIAPPDTNNFMDLLVDVGVNAFLMNIEVFDGNLRRLFMPGKSKIPKKRYFDAWKHALELVGAGNVGSVLIVGLESKYSTLRGAQALIDAGVIPTIMPFRPNDWSHLANFPFPLPDDVEYISREVGSLLVRHRLDPRLQPGCVGCTACAVESDYFALESAQQSATRHQSSLANIHKGSKM